MNLIRSHPLDFLVFGLFLLVTLGYHIMYCYLAFRFPPVIFKGKINQIRRSWVENMFQPGNAITAVQSLRNINMAASFLASSCIVFVGGIIYIVVSLEQTSNLLTGVETIRIQDQMLFLKFMSLIVMFLISLLNFSLCIRLLNYVTILVGASPKTIEATVGEDAITYVTRLFSRAGIHYSLGIRGFYYSIPLIFWFLGPQLFLIFTVLILLLIFTLDFGR